MTSVPKPFKFLKDHYMKFVETYERLDISLFKVNNKCYITYNTSGVYTGTVSTTVSGSAVTGE